MRFNLNSELVLFYRISREGDGAYTDDELSKLNDPFVKMLGEKAHSAKQRKAFAARERRNMADAVRELAERLHLDNVEIVTEPMEVKDRRGKVHHPKGSFNTKTGKITVAIPNHANVDDAVQTLLHEAVAHYGLRQLFGEHFDTFLRNVYEAADMDVRRRITELALRKYGGDFRVATEEYLASLAEDTDFENIPHGFWQKIKRMFLAMLHAIGFDGFDDMGVTLSDNELRYILWRSYENLKEPGEHRSILGEAEDVAKQVELKVGNYGDTAAEEEPADVAEELDARAEEIRNMPAIPIKKHDTSREYVREKYNSLGTAINKRDGKKVTFYHGVFGKMWRGENSLFAKIAPQLNDLFESSIYGFSSEDLLAGKKRPDGTIHKVHRNIDNYDYYVGKALINGKDYYVRFTVQNSEMKGNSGVHDVMVTDVSIYENSTGDASTSRRITGERLVANGTISDAKLMHLFGLDVNNSEKDADASEKVSEPKVGARPAQGTATTTDGHENVVSQGQQEQPQEQQGQGAATTPDEGSLQSGAGTAARPAQGAATTTGEDSLQTATGTKYAVNQENLDKEDPDEKNYFQTKAQIVVDYLNGDIDVKEFLTELGYIMPNVLPEEYEEYANQEVVKMLDRGLISKNTQPVEQQTGRATDRNSSEEDGNPDNGVPDWYANLHLSGKTDQNGNPFVLSPEGEIDFANFDGNGKLPSAPIRLSLGDAENGYIHINRRHGKQIMRAGFRSIGDFVTYVANNFTRIKEGEAYDNESGGKNQTYLLQLQDGHNNTLFVQLSRDGSYWNVNSAGVFGKKYGDKKKDVWSASEVQNGEPASASGGLQSEPLTGNGSSSNGTPPNSSAAKLGNSSESADKKSEKISAIDRIPSDEVTDKTGNTRTVHHWEQAEPGDTYDALTEIYHDNADRVKKGVQNRINTIDKQIKATQKKMDAIDNSDDFDAVAAQGEQYDRLQQQKDALEQQKKYWQGVQSVPLNRRAEQDKRTEAEQAAAKAERAKAEAAAIEEARRERERVNGVPDVVNDTPSDARKRGFRNVNGMVVERQQKTDGVTGRESSVKFSSKDTAQGHIKVIDADELQPSHVSGQRNPQFFIDEAQPKDRTDAASSMAAAKIASSLNPEEITGDGSAYQFSAPTVNSRGEVIQGNNRSDALKLMYSTPAFQPAQDAYKQYIIDHASDFGFTPEDVERIKQMKHPVMVNELDVSDDEAIRLGQMKASDNESGGIERIDPVTTSKKLGSKVGSFARILLSSGDEDASLSDVLAENGGKAVQWLRAQGVISDTAEQSAFDKKGNLTAEAKQDLQNILKQSLFEGGVSDLPTMFERMPAKAQKAILSTFMRDFDSAEGERILSEIQKAIEAWYGCATSNDAFAKAGNYKSARAAMRDWTLQTNMLDDSMPSDKFSNFAMELACRLQGCTMREVQQNLNDFFDLVQGKSQGDLFGGTTMGEQADRQEAIRRVFDIDYKPIKNKENGKKGSDAVADNNSQGGEGRPGSPGDGAGRERAAGAGQHADVAGGAESHDEGPKVTLLDAVKALYSKGKEYSKKLYQRTFFYVSDTPQFMKDLGLRGDRFTIKYGVISRHFDKDGSHDLTEDEWEQLPQALQAPFAISRLSNKKDGYRLYTTLKNSSGEYIVVGADVKNGGRDIEVNAISTVFGRRQNANLTENEEVIYRSKNITPDQSALLDRPNSDQYPTEGELSSAAKLGNSSESSDKKSEKVAEGADNSVKEAAAEQQRPAERSNDSVHSIGATDTPGKVAAEREAVNTEPTDGQKEAGNYKKGHIKVDGYDITIENPKGSTRSGKDASGKAWSVPMHYDYGYIKGTEGVDGDHIDVYLSDDPTQGNVYVIDQVNQNDGTFDEHKVMYGFPSMKAAVDAYKGQYEDGWKVGTVTEVSREDFKKWVESSKRKTKPFAEYKSVETAAQQQRPTDSIEARPAQGAATTTDVRTHERTSLQSGEKDDVKQMKAGGGVVSVSKREAALRDAVVDLEREAGLDVIDDVEEGQRVLDMANDALLNKNKKRALETASLGTSPRSLTAISSADGAKVLNNLDTLVKECENSATQPKTFIGDVADALGIPREKFKDKSSRYVTFETKNGKIVTIRISDHNATASNLDVNGQENAISIVVTNKPNAGITNDGDAHIVEYYYNAIKLRKAEGKPLADIVRSIKQALYSGEFKDTTGLAERQEVNIPAKVRKMMVYHGSAADFDAFDHSHMGEGEGAQAHGWGTYVTKNKGVGMTYASKSSKATGLKRSELESNIHRAEDQLPYLHGDVKAEKEKEIKAWKDELAKLDDTKLVYTVEIPDDTGDNYLEEAQTLQDLNRPDMAGRIDKVMDDYFGAKDFWNSWQTPGLTMREEFIRLSMGQHLEKSRSDAERKYSELLSEAGVVGLHYNGRKDGDCYVIFNDKDLKIKDKVRFFRTADGDAYGYTVGGKIYIDPRIATSETPIHEYAHLWAEALRKANPKEWQNVVELMKECKSVWEQVKKEYPELKTDDEIADEVLAHYSGRRGAERLRQEAAKATEDAKGVLDKASVVSAFGRLREAIKKAWKHIAEDILHIHFTSADEVADKVMYDLLNKVKPGDANRDDSGYKEDRSYRSEDVEAANKRFNDELDAFKNKTSKGLLHLGTPSPILRSCGVAVKELTLSPSVLHQHLKKHGLTTDDLKNLVMGLRNPMLVYIHGLNVPNMVVVTSFDTLKGKLSIALRLDNKGQVVGINNIT